MSQPFNQMSTFDMADQFIAIANRLVEIDMQQLGEVGIALRYAAARFSAHEASVSAADLAAEKKDSQRWFTDQFQKMLIDNIDQHIEMKSNNYAQW